MTVRVVWPPFVCQEGDPQHLGLMERMIKITGGND